MASKRTLLLAYKNVVKAFRKNAKKAKNELKVAFTKLSGGPDSLAIESKSRLLLEFVRQYLVKISPGSFSEFVFSSIVENALCNYLTHIFGDFFWPDCIWLACGWIDAEKNNIPFLLTPESKNLFVRLGELGAKKGDKQKGVR
jgi:hypothetical protein